LRRVMMRVSWPQVVAVTVLGSVLTAATGCGGGGNVLGTGDKGESGVVRASATLVDTQGRMVGTARFSEAAGGDGVSVRVEVAGLPPGPHGIHVHAVGVADPNASPPFATAGGHFNPENRQHGLNNPSGAHAGDLPNLVVAADGTGVLDAVTERLTLSPGPNSIFDADGSAVIIHTNADDQVTNPTGNSGGRIAGGVIVRP
jgi:Cu-Zn family superoxide dismutase